MTLYAGPHEIHGGIEKNDDHAIKKTLGMMERETGKQKQETEVNNHHISYVDPLLQVFQHVLFYRNKRQVQALA